MFVISKKLRELPRLLLLLTGWGLLSHLLGDILTPLWIWSALPVALIVGYAAAHFPGKFSAPIFIIAVPWVFRLVVSIPNLAMPFDNGWLLTAPFWYFASASTYFYVRSRSWGRYEALILGALITALLSGDTLVFPEMTVPAVSTLKLVIAVVVLIMIILAMLASFSRPVGKSGAASRIIHGIVLLVGLLLLVFSAARLRSEDTLQEGGGVLAGDFFRFDFNDVLSLEPEISLNSELTMLYREDGPPVLRYLRRFTLSGWDENKGFFRDGARETDIPGNDGAPKTLPRGPESWDSGNLVSRVPIAQEYYLVALDPSSFFSLNMPIAVEPWIIWDDASFSRAYGVESSVSVAGPWELFKAESGQLDSELKEYYLAGGDDESYRRLAEEASQGADSSWEIASAIERWFLDNYFYSLKPGLAPDGDQLSWFLFETRRGYCSYYAFAMTRMCRSLGIPARVAVGFVNDPETSVLGFAPIRSDQAHAWVEVWLDDFGWIEFDPTSQTMAPGEEYPFQFLDPAQWLPLVEEVLARSGEIDVALTPEDETDTESGWQRLVRNLRRQAGHLWMLLPLFLLVLWLPGRILPFLKSLSARWSSDPRRRCAAEWRVYAGQLIRMGDGPDRKQTALAWAARVEGNGARGFRKWTEIYLKSVFSPDFDEHDLVSAEEAARECRSWYAGLSRPKRWLAFLGAGWRGQVPW